jgi:hypothetical protein
LLATFTTMAVGLLGAVLGTRAFGQELANLHREGQSGLCAPAFVLGKALGDLPLITAYAFLYCVAYFLVAAPAASFGDFFLCLLLLEFVMFGVGYVASLLLQGENALLLAAISALLGGLATDQKDAINQVCWASWFSEALVLSEARVDLFDDSVADGQADQARMFLRTSASYDTDRFATDIGVLLAMGVALRVLAFLLVLAKLRRKS